MLVMLAGFALPAGAQSPTSSTGDEHRYQFTLVQEPSSLGEKLMLESLSSLDPEMRVDVDRAEQTVRILAYRPLAVADCVALAAQAGVTITPRRRDFEFIESNENR